MADIVEDRIHRIRHQFSALIAQPFGGQHHRLAGMLGLKPVDDLRGDQFPRAVALNQIDQAANHRVEQHLMAIIFGHTLQHRGAGFGEIDLINGLMHRAFQ
ncbi:hypothetical protein D3C76_927680 [compost metagenome]